MHLTSEWHLWKVELSARVHVARLHDSDLYLSDCITAIAETADCRRCFLGFSDWGGTKREPGEFCRKSALHHSREQRKRGERTREGGRGAQQGESGVCLHWPSYSSGKAPPLLHYWRVKGTFKRYQTDRNKCREAGRRGSKGARETGSRQKDMQADRHEWRKMK